MVTSAISSFGAILRVGDGGGTEVFTAIAELKDLSGPNKALATQEATTHASPGKAREFISTLVDNGEVSATLNFLITNATHDWLTGLMGDLDDGTRRNFQLQFPDAGTTTAAFSAFVTQFNPSAPVDGILEAEITLKLTGLITWS